MRKMSIKRNGEIILNFPFLNFFIGKMKVMQVFSVVLYPISIHTIYLIVCSFYFLKHTSKLLQKGSKFTCMMLGV